jgi:Holliday junction DNA helicase RuvA
MIAFLQGYIISLDGTRAVIQVQGTGIGYEVFLSSALLTLAGTWEEIRIFVYHHITEAGQTLFGFLDEEEKEIFRKLLSVSGVGGKTAQNILGLGRESVLRAIELEDDKLLSSVPWVGRKTAQKIIVDLKGSIHLWAKTLAKSSQNIHQDKEVILISSLIQMGYDKNRVESVVRELNPTESLEVRTVEAIKKLAR